MSNNGMDKHEIRRVALQNLVDAIGYGAMAEIHRRTGIESNYLSRCLYAPGKAGRKNIGEDTADKITGAFPGWLDGVLARTGDDGALRIPQYDVAGAMGNGGLVLDEKPPGIIKGWKVDEQWLRMNVPAHTGIGNLCIVTGFGSSMQPMFNPGDPLLMDRGVMDCTSDGVYFFRIGDHGYIKQLQRIPTTQGTLIRAKSLNPTYDPFEISQGMDFHVLGKILMAWKSEKV